VAVPAGGDLQAIVPYVDRADGGRRDGLGTTHHEAGTLAMGDDPAASATDADGRFHSVTNAYAIGPALFPTVGSPNPMLTGVALARRMADHLTVPPFTPDPGFKLLFDGASTDLWRMSKITNQPRRDNPGTFLVVDRSLESLPGTDLGLFWHIEATPPDFILKLEWLRWRDDDNSGVFLRFPDPNSKGYDNTAYVAINFGFEVQIDQLARDDGAPIHKTGAIYGFAGPDDPDHLPVHPPGEWNEFEIHAQGKPTRSFSMARKSPSTSIPTPTAGPAASSDCRPIPAAWRSARSRSRSWSDRRSRGPACRTSVRVLHLTAEFPPFIWGGLGTAVGGLAAASAQAGLEVKVLLVGGAWLWTPDRGTGRGSGRRGGARDRAGRRDRGGGVRRPPGAPVEARCPSPPSRRALADRAGDPAPNGSPHRLHRPLPQLRRV
jgi:3-keto-disaccharide hydrolase/GMC oxidoreductase/glycosyl transferase family 5 (putative starch synthase catalytic subunit)